MIEVDVLVEGGTIVDGTGAPGFAGAVAVIGDRLLVLRRRSRRRRAGGRRSTPDGASTPGASWSHPASSTSTATAAS